MGAAYVMIEISMPPSTSARSTLALLKLATDQITSSSPATMEKIEDMVVTD